MTDFTRRTIVRGTAWTVPVIALAATAPAFATSQPICNVTAECKEPGAGQNTKDYRIRTNCGTVDDARIENVWVFKNESKTDYIPGTLEDDGSYLAKGFKDSRAYRYVRIFFNDGTSIDYNVAFPPC